MRKIILETKNAIYKKNRYKKRYVKVRIGRITNWSLVMWTTLIARQCNGGMEIKVGSNPSRTLVLTVNGVFNLDIKNNKKTGLTFDGKPWNGGWKSVPSTRY